MELQVYIQWQKCIQIGNNSKSQCELKQKNKTKQLCALKKDYVWSPSICAIECDKDCNIDEH